MTWLLLEKDLGLSQEMGLEVAQWQKEEAEEEAGEEAEVLVRFVRPFQELPEDHLRLWFRVVQMVLLDQKVLVDLKDQLDQLPRQLLVDLLYRFQVFLEVQEVLNLHPFQEFLQSLQGLEVLFLQQVPEHSNDQIIGYISTVLTATRLQYGKSSCHGNSPVLLEVLEHQQHPVIPQNQGPFKDCMNGLCQWEFFT